jgi:hypothetical protein
MKTHRRAQKEQLDLLERMIATLPGKKPHIIVDLFA